MNIEHLTVDEVISAGVDVPATQFERLVNLVREQTMDAEVGQLKEDNDSLKGEIDQLEVTVEVMLGVLKRLKEQLTDDEKQSLELQGVDL